MLAHLRWALVGALLALAGCATGPTSRTATVAPYRPSNVFCLEPKLPATLRRVAVLPLTSAAGANSAIGILEPTVQAELLRQKAFELTFVTREQAREWTGQATWDADDKLPPDFFKGLSAATGCNGVLFCRVTTFSPYPPLVIGWRFKLVTTPEPVIWWTVDEVFDAGSLPAIAGAERFAREELNLPSPLLDNQGMLNSPRRFGQYSIQAALGTLPKR